MRKFLKITTIVCLIILSIFLFDCLFGTLQPIVKESSGDWMLYTKGGYLEVMVWSDYWKYGAMILRETETDWKQDENGCRSKTSTVTWWLRFEWFKR